jgi:mycofactocin precursor
MPLASWSPPYPATNAKEPSMTEDSINETVEQDLLVEDVSIDGMCGVY